MHKDFLFLYSYLAKSTQAANIFWVKKAPGGDGGRGCLFEFHRVVGFIVFRFLGALESLFEEVVGAFETFGFALFRFFHLGQDFLAAAFDLQEGILEAVSGRVFEDGFSGFEQFAVATADDENRVAARAGDFDVFVHGNKDSFRQNVRRVFQ